MSGINTTLNEQTGGWHNVSILSVDEIECPDLITNSNANNIVITPIANSLDILPVGENIKINETPRLNKIGTLYIINAEFEMAYQSAEVDDYFNSFLHKEVVLIALKHSGQKKLYGSKKFPLTFNYKNIHGDKYENGNRIRITITGKTPQKPVFMST